MEDTQCMKETEEDNEEDEEEEEHEKCYRIASSKNGKKVAIVQKTWDEFVQAEYFDEKFYIEDQLAEHPDEWKEHQLSDSILLSLLLLSKSKKKPQDATASSTNHFVYRDTYGILSNPANVHTASVDMVKLAQNKVGPLLPFLPLSRVIALVAQDYTPTPILTPPLVHVLGEVLEKYLTSVLKSAQVGSFHAKRFGVQAADFSIVRSLRGERSAQSYKQQQPQEQPQQQPMSFHPPPQSEEEEERRDSGFDASF
jgi:histone H3/H4